MTRRTRARLPEGTGTPDKVQVRLEDGEPVEYKMARGRAIHPPVKVPARGTPRVSLEQAVFRSLKGSKPPEPAVRRVAGGP
jgi:hypothetical protein